MTADENLIGHRLGQFLLEQQLDPWGGQVYQGIHVERRQSLAVKVLADSPGTDQKALDEFARELQLLKTLEHPHVLRCFGGGVHEGRAYLALELIRGPSLRGVIKKLAPLPWQEAVGYAKQICAALEYAFSRGLIHRCLRPENVLVTQEGVVKLAGWRRQHSPDGPLPDLNVQPLEKLIYVAPEQIVGRPGASQKTDLYALGCIVYELLTGRPPFRAEQPRELAQQHLTEQPPRVSLAAHDCPIWLDALVAQLLEKQPDKRPHSAGAVAVALEETRQAVREGAGAAGVLLSRRPTALHVPELDPEAKKKLLPARKKPVVQKPFYERVWFLSLCLAGVIAICVWGFWPPSEEKLFARAKEKLQSDDPNDKLRARDDFLSLLERFPDGEYADEAQAYLDEFEVEKAQERLDRQTSRGKQPDSAAARTYLKALRYEDFGDRATSIERLQVVLERYDRGGEERPYVLMAERELTRLQAGPQAIPTRAEVLQAKLDTADGLVQEGAREQAEIVWEQLIDLYRDIPDAEPFFQAALKKRHGEEDVGQPDEDASQENRHGE